MPEMHFRVKWPDGQEHECYSPSYIIEEYLSVGERYPVEDFVDRVRKALSIASERVFARYGFECSSALDQLRSIEQTAGEQVAAGAVTVLGFAKHAPRDARSKKPESFAVVVVGGGQAGLSVSYLLKQRGISHVVLEGKRIANAWRAERWDSFCLVTPNWQCRLPGHPYTGDDPQGFMGKDDIVAYVESYAARFELPVREGVTVKSVKRAEGLDGFDIETSAGKFKAEQVVIATGGYHRPRIPGYAQELSGVTQLHSSEYRNSQSLPDGGVLVVGTGQSGCQIAEDLHLLGRKVHLAVGSAPRCARRHRGRDVVEWLEEMGHYDLPIDKQANPDELRERANHYVTGRAGGHDLDLRRFALEGMQLYGPALGLKDGALEFAPKLKQHLDHADDVYRSINRAIDKHIEERGIDAPPVAEYAPPWEPGEEPSRLDLAAAGISTIVWATGFHTDFSWVELPAFDGRGRVEHHRGVTQVPGLFFIGLPWLHTWGSGRFSGVATDAEYLMERIAPPITERPPSFSALSAESRV